MTIAAGEKSPSPGPFTVVGTRPLRHDGLDKVTGHARYGADVHMPGLLHGKVLRSPHAHARIRSIDTSQAEGLPGVQAVATARDFPITDDRVIDFAEVQGNTRMMAENILAACQGALQRPRRGGRGSYQSPHRRGGPHAHCGGL
jgi:xanthine dehydrogenase molybdenum-binding subunit